MMSCIFLLYISVFAAPCPAVEVCPAESWLVGTARVQEQTDPDALYARREDLASARQAEAIWSARLARDTRDFESAWKLARTRYWLGGHAPAPERKKYLEGGIAAARAAVAAEPNRPEGHFWIAANMGALAESFGLRQGLKYRGEIRDELLAALKIDPAYQQGSADRALGRWYFKVPGLLGGSSKKSEAHLRQSLKYAPNSTITHFFLAETLLGMDRKTEAMQELQSVLDAPVDPAWVPEDREYKDKAQRLLTTLRQKRLP
jgi:hypothetical protein